MAPSIALVVLDTVRKDKFDEYFDWLPGERFERAYSTANWTGPAHASLFAGKYGSELGVHSKSRGLDCEEPVLAEVLSANGYTTRGWSANTNVSPSVGFDRGFGEFVDHVELQYPNVDLPDFNDVLSDASTTSRFERYLHAVKLCFEPQYDTVESLKHGLYRARGKWPESPVVDDGASTVLERLRTDHFGDDEFLFVNLMEAHTPYYVPEEYDDFDGPVEMAFGEAYVGVDDPDTVRRAYDIAVQYLASIYEDIFSELEAKFDYVITLSDHGELLGEHHSMWNHVSGIYPELTHVPLVITGRGFEGRQDTPVSLLDVHRTIAKLAGVEVESRGRSLTGDLEPREYLAEYNGPFPESLEQSKERGLDLDVYDTELNALIGPGDYYGYEDYDGWHEHGTPSVDDPQRRLHELLDELDRRDTAGEASELSTAAMSRLKELGYV